MGATYLVRVRELTDTGAWSASGIVAPWPVLASATLAEPASLAGIAAATCASVDSGSARTAIATGGASSGTAAAAAC